ncbi:MAG: glucose-6-phosphate isomerase [Gordonia sp. (in: high G+C Gram-positive bacteria)]|uniref:glucose-6-phosphate isomerase n=1 Tax=Gordonia sp. (in: high G+C Gram-positive bacteria) TaxID=84139 RepID=UPI003BB768BD
MTSDDVDITATARWHDLAAHQQHLYARQLGELFAMNPDRGRQMVVEAGDLHIDYSKNLATDETLELLIALARDADLEDLRDAMFGGEHLNSTEDRAALHIALRLPRVAQLVVDGQDVVADVHQVLDAMAHFADQVRDGEHTGHTGKAITDVVNIGIGGSDLGPAMGYQALRHYRHGRLRCHYVSNVDPADLLGTLAPLDPETTLFIIASKTFTTQETLVNARAARTWLLTHYGDDAAVADHFVAVSTNTEQVEAFGIDTGNMFGFWNWVGGRYSLDSAIGLSLMIAVGPDHFADFLSGFHAIDEHFRTEPLESNAPVLLGLLALWYSNFWDAQTHAVLPYANDLARFPAYLQQLMMESNGKSVTRTGRHVTTPTESVVWGEPGTNGQHAFFQLLHQGTWLIPADFIGFAAPLEDLPTPDGGSMHDLLMSNFFAQTQVLAFGKTADDLAADGVDPALAPHKVMPGNRPSTTILAPKLTPSVLGQLIALYEHQVFVKAMIWGINPFDQWGVELGKQQAGQLLGDIAEPDPPAPLLDSSTDELVRWYRKQRARTT